MPQHPCNAAMQREIVGVTAFASFDVLVPRPMLRICELQQLGLSPAFVVFDLETFSVLGLLLPSLWKTQKCCMRCMLHLRAPPCSAAV